MADKVTLDDATRAKIDALAEDVSEIKHLLKALATALDMRAVVEGNAEVEAKLEGEQRSRQDFDKARKGHITWLLAWGGYVGPPGAACRKWLEAKLAGNKYGPMRAEDIERFSKLQDAPG